MHITQWNTYRTFRFYDGMSKANVGLNFGKITLTSSYVNDVDYLETSYLEIYYR